MGRRKKKPKAEFVYKGVRLDEDTVAQGEDLAQRFASGNFSRVARAALRLGLDALEKSPELLLEPGD